MRESRIAERITGSLAVTGHCMAEAVSGYAVVREDRDGAHIVKQTKQPEASSPADDGGAGTALGSEPGCWRLSDRPVREPSHRVPDPTGLQVLKKCRVSGRRH